jgi:hypothetical protein
MLYSAKEVRRCKLVASDGELGGVHDLLFDDRDWGIRYVVVDTKHWLPGRRVLIPKKALVSPDWEATELGVDLTREEIENQPGVESDPPLAVQARLRHYRDYLWTSYPWGGLVGSIPIAAESRPKAGGEDTHVRSMGEVTDYRIAASDGSIGHVEDFLFDGSEWSVRYLVVDTRNWLPGKKVVLSPAEVERVAWPDHLVHVHSTKKQVRNARPLEETGLQRA